MNIDVSKHDRWQLELKLLHEKTHKKTTNYEVGVWFVLHPSIGVQPRNFGKDEFFRDCRTYTRLSIQLYS